MLIQNILGFINELKNNNNREWFTENKVWYDVARKEFEELSKLLIIEISKFDKEITHVEAKDCIFRIYRDTRFSHDKTPYKTHFGVYIAAEGGRKSQRAGYYLHLEPGNCFVGSGVWCPEPHLLKALRQSVFDNIDEFNEIRYSNSFSKYYQNFLEEGKLKTVPRGFSSDFKDAELLKLKHYLVDFKLPDDILISANFVTDVAHILEMAYPFNTFLNYTVDEIK